MVSVPPTRASDDDDARTVRTVARVDRYELLEPLGEGGFGVVWRARNAFSGQAVALKLIHREVGDEAAEHARLFKEARTAASIGHPGIVRVFDCGVSSEGQAFLVMELIDGRNLGDVLDRDGAFAVPRAARIAREVLDVLTAAHAVGVIHRDVKPANVLLEARNGAAERVRLVDFGISKARPLTGATLRTRPGTALGTPGFMAPEQYGSAHEADARADVYGVGATLYTMLSGQKPFGEASFGELLARIHVAQPTPLAQIAPYVPAGLASVVDRALARDPAARWQTAAQLAQAIDEALRPSVRAVSLVDHTMRVTDPRGPIAAPATRVAPVANTVLAPVALHAFVAPPRAPRRWVWIALPVAAALMLIPCAGYVASERGWLDREPAVAAVPKTDPPAAALPVEPAPVAPRTEGPASVPEENAIEPLASAAGVTVSDVVVTGAMDRPLADALGRRAAARLVECRPAGHRPANLRVQLQINGHTHLAHPDGDSPDGSTEAARCAAARFAELIDPAWTGYNVILSYGVELQPR